MTDQLTTEKCPEEECWYGITDPKQRKRIQDRLAQRARRRRIAEAKAIPKQTTNLLKPSKEPVTTVSRDSSDESFPDEESSLESQDSDYANTLLFSTDHIHLNIPDLTVHTALLYNGQILGLSCQNSVPSTSVPAADHVPDSLRPTNTQLTIVHSLFIDRFPFPRMRDNMILLTGVLDEDSFVSDIFTDPSFTLKPGYMSWDPNAWVVEEPFREKWGYLLT